MSLWFLISLLKKRNDVADVAWGLGFVILSWVSFFLSEEYAIKSLLICILVSIWGLRLTGHIHARHIGKTEDYRYLTWRQEWGKWFYLRSYFQIYILQGLLLFLIVLPILIINKSTGATLNALDFLGLTIWLFGFYFEVIGDAELAKFIRNPINKGKLLTTGLWSYSRHPNYFGEVTQWWGLWLMTLSIPNGWISIIGPITITFLILKVSGIPMLEEKLAENKDFADYKKNVSIFFPLPPKKKPS